MSEHSLAVAILLSIAGLVALLSVAGVALMPGTFNRLHYLAPVSTVSAGAIALAVLLVESFDSRGIKAVIVAVVLAGLNPIVVHATARAARVREHGDWRLEQPSRRSKGRT